jgi:hypothetical protein
MIYIKNLIKQNKGSMLVITLIITELFLILTLGTIALILLEQRLYINKVASQQAFHVAEAGVNYYRWALYHEHNEYCNNEVCKADPENEYYGPYAYLDSGSGLVTGYYILYIIPPPVNGSTIVIIKSVGWVADYPNIKRTIEVRCGIPSWTTYSVMANDNMRFGEGTEIWGPIHSNLGIRFDGVAHNLVTSSQLSYDDPDHSGADEFGVHTHKAPTDPFPDGNNPPENIPSRTDIFLAGRSFPVGNISFSLLDNYAYATYGLATSSGLVFDPQAAGTADPSSVAEYRGCGLSGGTCDEGFHITLLNDNTFNIRGVSAVYAPCSGNSSDSIQTEEAVIRNYTIPANGLVFVKKRIWIDGQIANTRVNILAFEEPFANGTADIIINSDLLYTDYSGADAIGLIAQRNISVGQYSADTMRIDGALIARDGRIGRNYYGSGCVNRYRSSLTLYGSLATNQRYGFAWVNASGNHTSGYSIRNIIYDNNLTFSPPPHYPTTGEYTFISWDEK